MGPAIAHVKRFGHPTKPSMANSLRRIVLCQKQTSTLPVELCVGTQLSRLGPYNSYCAAAGSHARLLYGVCHVDVGFVWRRLAIMNGPA